jgi:hypothetical protein
MATKLRLNAPIGRNHVSIEADGLKALFMASGFFADIPTTCGNCNSDDLMLAGKKNAGFDFYSVLCRKCRHELKFGQRKEDGGLWLKLEDGWCAPFQAKGGSPQPGRQGGGGNQQGSPPPDEEDDIPF